MKRILLTMLSTFMIIVMFTFIIPITALAEGGTASSENMRGASIGIDYSGSPYNGGPGNLITNAVLSVGVHVTGIDLGNIRNDYNGSPNLMANFLCNDGGSDLSQILKDYGLYDRYKAALNQYSETNNGSELSKVIVDFINKILESAGTPTDNPESGDLILRNTLYDTILPSFAYNPVDNPVVTFINGKTYWYAGDGGLIPESQIPGRIPDQKLQFFMVPTRDVPGCAAYDPIYLKAMCVKILDGSFSYQDSDSNELVKTGLVVSHYNDAAGINMSVNNDREWARVQLGNRDDNNTLPVCPVYFYSTFAYRAPDGLGGIKAGLPDGSINDDSLVINSYLNFWGDDPANVLVPSDSRETLNSTTPGTDDRGIHSRRDAWLTLVPSADLSAAEGAWRRMMYPEESECREDGTWRRTTDTRGAMNMSRMFFYNWSDANEVNSEYAPTVEFLYGVADYFKNGAALYAETHGQHKTAQFVKQTSITPNGRISYGKGWFAVAGKLTPEDPPNTGSFVFAIDASCGASPGEVKSGISFESPNKSSFGIHVHPHPYVREYSLIGSDPNVPRDNAFAKAFKDYDSTEKNCTVTIKCESNTGEISRQYANGDQNKVSAHIKNVNPASWEIQPSSFADVLSVTQDGNTWNITGTVRDIWSWLNQELNSFVVTFDFDAEDYAPAQSYSYTKNGVKHDIYDKPETFHNHVTDWTVQVKVPEDMNIKYYEGAQDDDKIDGYRQTKTKPTTFNAVFADGDKSTTVCTGAGKYSWYTYGTVVNSTLENILDGKGASVSNVLTGSDINKFGTPPAHEERTDPSTTPLTWTINTNLETNAFGEVVGNAVGGASTTDLAQDWNVSQGIPSTENVSVALGGEAFKLSLGGLISGMGACQYTTVDNTGDGKATLESGSEALTRTIRFHTYIDDIWGPTSAADPTCDLSCSREGSPLASHVLTGGGGFTVSTSASQGSSESKTENCPVCGQPYHSESHTSIWSGTHGSDPPSPCSGNASRSDSITHNCQWKLVYNCSDASFTIGYTGADSKTGSGGTCGHGSHSGSTSGSRAGLQTTQEKWKSPNNQRWFTHIHVTNGTEQKDFYFQDNTELCEGYTTPDTYGCVHHDKKNCVHRYSRDFNFYVKEHIDTFVYREITAAKVMALTHGKITKADTSLFKSDPTGLGTTNTNLTVNVWQGGGDADMSKKTGRLWFTQWKDKDYKNGSGWISTSNDTDYWLGNCTIVIHAKADSDYYNTDFAIKDASIAAKRGYEKSHYQPVGANTYTYEKEMGDWAEDSEARNEARHIVNAWMNANNDNYGVTVVSDFVEVKGVDGVYQNVTDECYSLDHIPLFNAPFTESRNSFDRYHRAKKVHISILEKDLKNNDQLINDYTDCGVLNQDFKTFFTGYQGVATANPVSKYTSVGSNYKTLEDSLTQGGSTLSRYTKHDEIWGLGSIQGTNVYKRTKLPMELAKAGTINVNLKSTGTKVGSNFTGYYTDFKYPTGNYSYVATTTGSTAQTTLVSGMQNSGALNGTTTSDGKMYNTYTSRRAEYSPLAISNIALDPLAYNGEYVEPIEAHIYYTTVLDFDNAPQTKNPFFKSIPDKVGYKPIDFTDFKAEFTKGDGRMNDVIVHTPVSVQYDQFIGNGYGYYDSDVVDESGEDMRKGYPKEENKKPNYALIGNTCHVWISDFGDYRDSRGTTYPTLTGKIARGENFGMDGADPKTGVINKNARGYVNNMNTGCWVQKREIRFEFPVSYIDTGGNRRVLPARKKLDLSTVKYFKDWHYGSDVLQNTMSYDKEFKWGRDYEFTILTSSLESKTSRIFFYAQAINDHNKYDEVPCQDHNLDRLYKGKKAASTVEQVPTIELAGRIGNLAIEDSGDFRFSNLFKTINETEWLIPGVVHKVNSARPNLIMATFNDILLDMTGHANTTRSHSTLSITSYPYGDEIGLGKAGNWTDLPLTAARNNIEEFKTEQPRIGYETFLDIETIGSYYGTDSLDATATYPNAAEEEGVIPDTRLYTMHIVPKYMLFDYAEGKFYAVDLYGGTSGNYTKYYGGVDIGTSQYFAESGLYIDFPQDDTVTTTSLTREEERRNVPILEKQITKINAGRFDRKDAAYKSADYIGTAYNITLDAADRDFIGSKYIRFDSTTPPVTNNNNSLNQLGVGQDDMTQHIRNNGLTGNGDFEINSQRWHFTLNLPSSTIMTYARPGSVLGLSQTEIINEAERLKKEHPHTVLVTFLDIVVKGTVYTLQYDAKLINDGTITIPLFGDVKPDDWKPNYTNDIPLTGDILNVYNEDGNVVDTIDDQWAPIIVNESYETSDKDLETYGTH